MLDDVRDEKRNNIGADLINIGAVLSNNVVVLSNVDAVLTLGRTLKVFSLYFQTFRMVLESFSYGFYDGTLRPIFRTMPSTGRGFSLERYVKGMANGTGGSASGVGNKKRGFVASLW